MADGTEVKQDVITSADPKGTSTATYTEEQVLERERKARSDALADAGRFRAESERANKAAQQALERLTKMEQDHMEAELEAHKDDPASIKAIRAEQKARQLETELAQERQAKTEYEARLQAIEKDRAEATKLTLAQTVAQKFNVDPAKLTTLAKLTDGSEQAIEAMAEVLPKVSQTKTFKPDSNRGIGGILTWEQIQANFIADPYNPTNRQRYLEAKGQR